MTHTRAITSRLFAILLCIAFINAPLKTNAETQTESPAETSVETQNQTPTETSGPSQNQVHSFKDGREFTYSEPKFVDVFTQLPESLVGSLKQAFTKETLWPWVGILVSTAYLYDQDEYILADIRKQGRDLGIGNSDNTKAVLRYQDLDLLRLPTDAGSFMYFLGDGWMHFGISTGMLIYGKSNDDFRAQSTAYQIYHGMILSTVYNQFLKRATGRESPNPRTEYRGKWSPFPSMRNYTTRTAEYDAMPSGHVMTASLVATVIYNNYPEYSNWILPVSATWVSLLAWEMVNNGVHWASDYPLGLAMGIYYGNYVFKNSRSLKIKEGENKKVSWTDNLKILPMANSEHFGMLVNFEY